MAHPLALTPRLLEERDELVVCRSLSKAHCLLGFNRSDASLLLIDLGDRRDQVLALLRARGLRFRDGSRWRLPTMIQVHLIDGATVAPSVRALRDLR